ncbi:SETMR methyltransferase, partial [Pseudoatta argentina]
MEINKKKIHYILQYYYDKGKNTAQDCKKICVIYGEDTLARKWFARFRTRNFDVKDEPRSGRSITEKSDKITEKVKRDKHVSTVEIARELGIDHKVKNMMDRINICDTLDEKWITYNNRTRKRLWIK